MKMNNAKKQFITSQKEDFSQWYQDVVLKSDLADHSPVKGCMIIKPYGYALWEMIQKTLDRMIKDTGHKNAYFPLFIPESFLQKEKEHVEGFSPEMAVVTIAGGKELEENLVVRPTSETIIYATFSKWIESYRDLPLLINQWANVVRWEKRTRLFLRTTEFLWQEGHTAHISMEEAQKEVMKMLKVYQNLVETYLAVPVIPGRKSESEKFAGALATYSLEAMMKDGKALQAGTSHNLGQNFAKAFDIKFMDKENKEQYAWQTSWGLSTRIIGALIMVHGDEKGLIMPPMIAPTQVIIVPIWKNSEINELIKKEVLKIEENLKSINVRAEVDWREEETPGFKFNEWELKGAPVRIEIGEKDIAKKQVVLARRDSFEKMFVSQDDLMKKIEALLKSMQSGLYENARKRMNESIFKVDSFDEFKKIMEKPEGFVVTGWCGDDECENEIKEQTGATIRNIPLDDYGQFEKCVYCSKKSKFTALFGKAY